MCIARNGLPRDDLDQREQVFGAMVDLAHQHSFPLFDAFAIADIMCDFGGADDISGRIKYRRDIDGHVHARAVPTHPHGFVIVDGLGPADPRENRIFLVLTIRRDQEPD